MTLLKKLGLFSVVAMSGLLLTTVGCDRKESIVDIETPGGDIEVERDVDTGAVDVDVDDE